MRPAWGKGRHIWEDSEDMIGHGVKIWGDRARESVGTKQRAGTRKSELRAEELKGSCVGGTVGQGHQWKSGREGWAVFKGPELGEMRRGSWLSRGCRRS